MKVLHLLDTIQIAGIERHLLLLAEALVNESVISVIGCRGGHCLETEAHRRGIATVRIFSQGGLLADRMRLERALQRDKYDLVHAHNGYTMLMAAWAQGTAGVAAIATQHFISVRHDQQYKGVKRHLARQAHRWVNRRLTRIIAVSRAAGVAMQAREAVEAEKIVVVPNGVPPCHRPDASERQAVRQALGIDGSAPLVVSVARLEREKGIHVLLHAIAEVRQSVPAVRLLIVGDGSERAALERQVRELSLQKSVVFAGYREDVNVLIGAGDLFVLPSLQEAFGLTLVEAMALRIAVIGTRTGGQREVVEDGVTGLLVPPGDAAAMAQAIVLFLKSPAMREAMGMAGYQRFLSCFSAERMARRTRQVYEEALAHGCVGAKK